MIKILINTIIIKTVGHFLHEIRDKCAASIEAEKAKLKSATARRRRGINRAFALALISLVFVSGCSFKESAVKWYDSVIGHTPHEVVPEPVIYDSTAEQEFLDNSPRFSHLQIPKGMKPTITFNKIDKSGNIEFTVKGLNSQNAPEHTGFNIMTRYAGYHVDSMSSYTYKDRRWNKKGGVYTDSVCVFEIHDSEGIKAFSRVTATN